MTLHVLFTTEGIPGWIGTRPRDGSEPVDGLSIAFLAAHRRTEAGQWVVREPAKAEPCTEEELEAQARAAYEAALLARDDALREALVREADPVFFRWQRGECTRDDWLTAVAEVKARFPKPDPV